MYCEFWLSLQRTQEINLQGHFAAAAEKSHNCDYDCILNTEVCNPPYSFSNSTNCANLYSIDLRSTISLSISLATS